MGTNALSKKSPMKNRAGQIWRRRVTGVAHDQKGLEIICLVMRSRRGHPGGLPGDMIHDVLILDDATNFLGKERSDKLVAWNEFMHYNWEIHINLERIL